MGDVNQRLFLEHVGIDLRDFREVDNRMAAHFATPHGDRKCLPYLMVNMLGRLI